MALVSLLGRCGAGSLSRDESGARLLAVCHVATERAFALACRWDKDSASWEDVEGGKAGGGKGGAKRGGPAGAKPAAGGGPAGAKPKKSYLDDW